MTEGRLIRVLDDRVINQIAAGEVVERPASVVKELVENALDAGARTLHVRLKAGGVSLIEVVDDGKGMEREDARTCIERHATSKITQADDLVGVATYGFRGEALPSIGSVARLEIRTRRPVDETGVEVVVDNGRLVHVDDVATPVGTHISVRSLFAEIPARRKFLKRPQVELDHAVDAVYRALLWRPDVEITLQHDGRTMLRSAAGDGPQRIRDLLGPDARVLVPVAGEGFGVTVRGWVAPVGVHRAAATGSIYLYVNGRFVRDSVARRALMEGFRGAIPAGRYPVAVVELEMPGEDVDVNVHPQKTEVRYRDPRGVIETLSVAVRDALREGVARRHSTDGPAAVRRAPEPTLWTSTIAAHPDDAGMIPFAAPAPPPVAHPDAIPFAARLVAPAPEPKRAPPVPADAALPQEPHEEPAPVVAAPAAQQWRKMVLHGLHDGRYALCSHDHDLVLVDVLAIQRADARSAFLGPDETHKAPIRTLPLLAPVVVALPRADLAELVRRADLLSDHGVEIAAFGPGEVAVTALPADVRIADVPALLRALVRAPDVLDALVAHAVLPPLTPYLARGLIARVDERPEIAGDVLATLTPSDLAKLISGR